MEFNLCLPSVHSLPAFVVPISQAGTRVITGSLAIDGPSLVLQGLILLIAIVSAMLMAERRVDPAGDAFSPRASCAAGI